MFRKIAILSLAVLVCSCSGGNNTKGVKNPIRVKVETASGIHDGGSLSYVGLIEESEATAVSFTGMGIVTRVLVNEGQRVSKGQLLAEMDDAQARNILANAEATMAQANDALERYGMLHDNGSLPEAKWIEIKSKVAQAQAQLDIARKNLEDCRLTAPCSGVIGKKFLSAGETALPSQAVVTILDITSVNVNVSIPEAEISSIGSNTPTTVKVHAAGDLEVAGGHIEKGVQADALTHTYNIRIKVSNPEGKLLPGMVADVRFPSKEDDISGEGIFLPVSCIQRQFDGSLFVWTVKDDNTASRTGVTIGRTRGNNVAIESGLDRGCKIITEGYQKLSEGTKVTF